MVDFCCRSVPCLLSNESPSLLALHFATSSEPANSCKRESLVNGVTETLSLTHYLPSLPVDASEREKSLLLLRTSMSKNNRKGHLLLPFRPLLASENQPNEKIKQFLQAKK